MKKAAQAKPNHGRVTILPIEQKKKTTILNPEKEKEKPQHGKVVAIGDRLPGAQPFVQLGSTVVFGKYAGVEIEFADGPHLVMMEADIISKI